MIFLKVVTLLLVIFILVSEGTIQYMNRTPMNYEDADLIVVLGNGSDSQSPSLNQRLVRAKEALHIYPGAKVLLTGDARRNEIEPMRQYLVSHGIDEERILIDSVSRSTWESAMNSLKFVSNKELQALVVTNDFHMNRALATFKAAGLNAQAFGRDSEHLPERAYYFFRERLSRVKWLAQYSALRLQSWINSDKAD